MMGLENADVYIARRKYENTKKRYKGIHALELMWRRWRRAHGWWVKSRRKGGLRKDQRYAILN